MRRKTGAVFMRMTREAQCVTLLLYCSREMVFLKRSKFTDAKPPDDRAIAKIGKLAMESIAWYERFIGAFSISDDPSRTSDFSRVIRSILRESVVKPKKASPIEKR